MAYLTELIKVGREVIWKLGPIPMMSGFHSNSEIRWASTWSGENSGTTIYSKNSRLSYQYFAVTTATFAVIGHIKWNEFYCTTR